MNIILYDDSFRDNFLPFVYTRPVCDLRIGILTLREKWEKRLKIKSSDLTKHYLKSKFKINITEDNILINSRVLSSNKLVDEICKLEMNHKLVSSDRMIAIRVSGVILSELINSNISLDMFECAKTTSTHLPVFLNYNWDLFVRNAEEIKEDFFLLSQGRSSVQLSKTNQVIGNSEQIFIEEGASIECSILNTSSGPIYIGKQAEIMEGSVVRGPFALCDNSTLKMGTKIYGATTIGPHSKVGGEINNSIIFGYTNKAHDGFLGNSVIGEWCNLGADTNNSNLKNNYSEIKVWNYLLNSYQNTGLQFCGLFMGDHSKSGINTMFNTGTVVGVSANVYGSNFPPKHIPSFTWGGTDGIVEFDFTKAQEVASKVMERRNIKFDEIENEIFQKIFDLTKMYR